MASATVCTVMNKRTRPKYVGLALCGFVLLRMFMIMYENTKSGVHQPRTCNRLDVEFAYRESDVNMTFDGSFDNNTGAGRFIVPNIIHFIRYNQFELNFVDYVVLKAAMLNHKPDKFFIHTNILNVQYTGKYWRMVQDDLDLWSRIKVLFLQIPTTVFGKTVSEKWRLHHGSDIARLWILRKYGGIYLDNDAYVIRCLDKYRKFEAVVNCEENDTVGNQVIIAHKNARFLLAWRNSYQDYKEDLWYYNGGEVPSEIIELYPDIVHRLKGQFGVHWYVSLQLYVDQNFDWRKLDVIHLLVNHRRYIDPNFNQTPIFNEETIKNYTYPFGDMAREVLDDIMF